MRITHHQYIFNNKEYYPYINKFDLEFLKKVLTNKRNIDRSKQRKTKLNKFRNKKALAKPIKKRWSKKTQLKFLY